VEGGVSQPMACKVSAGVRQVWCRAQPGLATRRAVRRAGIILLAGLLAATPARAETLSGRWCGIGEQSNPGGEKSYWTINLRLDGREGHIEYPSLDCGGVLTFERTDSSVNMHFFRERITYGRDRCLDGGLLGVQQIGAALRWEWAGRDPGTSAEVKASATLSSDCAQKPGNAKLRERTQGPA
jgi:hypothetical protein